VAVVDCRLWERTDWPGATRIECGAEGQARQVLRRGAVLDPISQGDEGVFDRRPDCGAKDRGEGPCVKGACARSCAAQQI
jgi:hypothetical protein